MRLVRPAAGRILDYLVVPGLICLLALVYAGRQPITLVGDGYGWDGKAYHAMYEYLANQVPISGDIYPFCKRIVTPWLASRLPFSEFQSFLWINLISGALCSILTFWLARIFFGIQFSFVLTLPLLIGITAPIRFAPYYPVYIDPLFMLMCALSMLLLANGKLVSSSIVLLISVFIKETGLFILLSVLLWVVFTKGASNWQRMLIGVISLVSISASLYSNNLFHCSGSMLKTGLYWAYAKGTDFKEMVRFIASLLVTLAPFFACWVSLPIGRDVPGSEAINRHRIPPDLRLLCAIFITMATVMAFAGGGDSTRIFYSLYPLFFLILADAIDKDRISIISFAVVAAIVNYFPKKIPEPLALTPNNDISGYFSLFPEYAHLSIAATLIVFVVVCRFAYRAGRDFLVRLQSPT